MKVGRAICVGITLSAMLALGGCKKKKPATPPPQATAPTISEPAPVPAPTVEAPATQPAAQPSAPAPQPSVEKPKPKPKVRTRVAKKTPPPAKPPEKPSHTVVQQGGAQAPSAGQLSASIPGDTAVHQKFTTAQLLEATDYNLKSITRPLTADEQAMVQHIRSFMAQSRQATQDGDTERAYNLALKAHLLSDEIIKR